MSGRAVEAAGDVDVLLLDKTGTITLGNRQATRFLPGPGVSEQELAEAAHLASLAPLSRSAKVFWRAKGGFKGLPVRNCERTFADLLSSLLESPPSDESTRRELLESVSWEANRLGRLLENILQMSRLESGASAPSKQWHVLEEIVGSALHRTRQVIEHLTVQVRLPDDLPLIHVDALLLEQVFVNLLENAARYTPQGTTVLITAAAEDAWVIITVADDGPGIVPGTEDRIFEKFYRASPIVDAGRGSGLGLAICRAVLTAHGGKINASNRPHGGAEFVVRLPVPEDVPHVVVE